MDIYPEDRMVAAGLASTAIRRSDSPAKAAVNLMMAAILVAESNRDPQVAYFHFVATTKAAFDSLVDVTLETMTELRKEHK